MRDLRLSYGVLGAGAVSVLIFLTSPVDSVWQVVSFFVPFLLASALLAARVRVSPSALRGPLWVLLIGQVTYLATSLVWYLSPVVFEYELPFPSPLDAIYFAIYAAYALFLTFIVRRRAHDRAVESRIALTDSLILTTSVSAVLWVAVIQPNLASGTSILPTVVAVLYPGFTLLLFALAARLAISGGFARTAPGALLLTWIAAEVLGDISYGFQSANGTFAYGAPLTTTWMVSYTALGALAAHPGLVEILHKGAGPTGAENRGDETGSGVGRTIRLGVLLMAALVPLGLAAFDPEHVVALFMASAVTFALVTYRVSLLAGDLGEQRRLAAQLDRAVHRLGDQRDELARYAAIVDSTSDSVITVSPDGVISDWNHGAERLYGYTRKEALGQHVSMIAAPSHQETQAATMAMVAEHGHASVESVDVRRDGSTLHTSVTISNIYDSTGAVAAMVGISRDISDRKRAEEQGRKAARDLEAQARQLEHLAFHDPLTGLGNRALLTKRIAETIETARVNGEPAELGLIMLDLDDFKFVNDSLGHDIGDALLIAASGRLRDVVADAGIVTRLGGDEFAVIVPSGGEVAAVALGERILAAFFQDFHVAGHALQTTASVGISTGTVGAEARGLLRSTDLAMYAAKAAGKGKLSVYSQEMLAQAQQRLDLENHLRHAVRRGEFALAYQPIVDAATGTVISLEALARWEHPAWGTVSPSVFVPVAERSGAIASLGEWVLRTACRDAANLAAERGRPVRVSVNVSVRQLQSPDFVTVVRQALDDCALDPALLTLEVTESMLMDDGPRGLAALHELHQLGIRLSIDDFGTGHSSLARLRTLPVSELKIDRAFVSQISADGDCGPIITAIIAMARALGLSVVAEGVETELQLQALRRLGCDAVQGFLMSRPLPLSQLEWFAAPVHPFAPTLDLGRDQPEDHLIQLVNQLNVQAPFDTTMHQPFVTLVRDALAHLVAVTGLDAVYLTRIDRSAGAQEVLLAQNRGRELVAEGLVVDWNDTLCKRALENGPTYTIDISSCFPASPAGRSLGLSTYIGVPIRRTNGELAGTLCGASIAPRSISPHTRALIEVFAHLIGLFPFDEDALHPSTRSTSSLGT